MRDIVISHHSKIYDLESYDLWLPIEVKPIKTPPKFYLLNSKEDSCALMNH